MEHAYDGTAGANTVINLRRQNEPAGYALEISRKIKQAAGEAQRLRVLLSDGEAIGMRCVLQGAIFPLVYGIAGAALRL